MGGDLSARESIVTRTMMPTKSALALRGSSICWIQIIRVKIANKPESDNYSKLAQVLGRTRGREGEEKKKKSPKKFDLMVFRTRLVKLLE